MGGRLRSKVADRQPAAHCVSRKWPTGSRLSFAAEPLEVVFDRLVEVVVELPFGLPSEAVLEVARVDSVAEVVAFSIGHEGDEIGGFVFGPPELLRGERAEEPHEVEVAPFVAAADVVGRSVLPFMEDAVDGGSVVAHPQPVAYVFASAVNGNGPAVPDLPDHHGYEFFGVLVGPVVVGAVAHHNGEAVGVVPGAHEVIAAGFGGAVGRAGVVGGLLGEVAFGSEAAVDFVGADVVEQMLAAVGMLAPGAEGGVEEVYGADDVGVHEFHRVFDAAVYMALGGQVQDAINAIGLHDLRQGRRITNISLHEKYGFAQRQSVEVAEVPGVGELIEYHQLIPGVAFGQPMHQVRANKTRPPGNQ